MAAAATDLLQKVGIQSATTLDANYTINDATITVASTSGWPTDTGITFAMDVIDSAGLQVAGTYNEFVGTVSTATSITNVDYADGTGDRNYTAGATTRVYIPVSKTRENRIVTWGTTQHKQDGTHADTITTDTINENTAANGVTIDGLNIKDSKLTTANSVVTANYTDGSILPEHLVASTGTDWAWQSWTPTPTNFTVGTGGSAGIVAEYIQIGKTVHFRLVGTLGTSGFSVGAATFTLPVTASAAAVTQARIGVGYILDSSAGTYEATTTINSTTAIGVAIINTTFTYSASDGISSTKPMTWAANDKLTLSGTYEAA